jgi:hypothetical protein
MFTLMRIGTRGHGSPVALACVGGTVKRNHELSMNDRPNQDQAIVHGAAKTGGSREANRRSGISPNACYEKAHVTVDDATRLAYVEVLPDEQQPTTVGFLVRAVSWFNSQDITCEGVLSDNGSAYRSKQWRKACSALGLKAKRTKAYRSQTNGKAEWFIKTMQAEWAYAMPFASSDERKRWLPRYLSIYNGRRCHMALAGLTPLSAAPEAAGH